MAPIHRRKFVAGLGTALATFGLPANRQSFAQAQPRVVVVGGGFGGASVARWLRRIDPAIAVTLIERNARFVTCPFSNAVIAGLREIDSITFGYDGVRRAGVEVIQGEVIGIDAGSRAVRVAGGASVTYDRLVLAPGIQLVWGAMQGYDEAASEVMPHAWQAGPQTLLLRRRLEAMDDGGTVVIAVPDNPYRCPPGPYERASLIAWYLKNKKPRSKLIVLDAKETFSKQPLFQEAWRTLYPGLIEWRPKSQSGRVVSVNAANGTLTTEFDDIRASVANVIPPQRAGQVAIALGLDQGRGFCAVDPKTFKSRVQPGIHLIGNSIVPGGMPKSGFSANSQAKACARAVVGLLRGLPIEDSVLLNTCYSIAAPQYGFSIAGVFQPSDQGLTEVPGTVGTSALGLPSSARHLEADYGDSWYRNITDEMFG